MKKMVPPDQNSMENWSILVGPKFSGEDQFSRTKIFVTGLSRKKMVRGTNFSQAEIGPGQFFAAFNSLQFGRPLLTGCDNGTYDHSRL